MGVFGGINMRPRIENTEKITLYMTEKMSRELRQDAERFEAFNDDNYTPVMNAFLSALLANYYDQYINNRSQLIASIKSTLNTYVPQKKEEDLTNRIMEILPQHNKALFDGPKNVRVPLKPTSKTDKIITELKKQNEDRLSAPICDIFASYLSLPMFEREKIIFKTNTEKLDAFCKTNQPITLYLSSAKDPNKKIHIVPYKLVHGTDEMFNYLLCQTYNEKLESYVPSTMRLCRISEPKLDPAPTSLKPDVISLLDMMNQRGPAYTISEEIESRVLLTKDGMDRFSKVSFGRPNQYSKEPQPDGSCIYVFKNSPNQLYLYFRRFDAEDAKVLSPEKLVNQIKTFHEKAWKAYEQDEPITD